VVEFTKTTGVPAAALTDDDTVAGVGEAMEAGDEVGMEVVAKWKWRRLLRRADVRSGLLPLPHPS